MKTVDAGSRSITYAKSHHQVLEAWTNLRRTLSVAPSLVTLDRHTDFRPAFVRDTCRRLDPQTLGVVTPADIEREGAAGSALLAAHTSKAAKAAVKTLAHDEHIDAARQADIISDVFLLQSSTNGDRVQWATRHQFDVPDEATAALSLEPNRLDPFILAIEKKLGARLEKASYILDIDLDYFHTRAGAKPTAPGPFRRLVRNARLITIALEPQCVREPELLDHGISAKRLLELIKVEIANA